jgi:sporulation protein YlmC with PRC-barrel domain
VGSIDRVVIDPETMQVSHIVVRKGWLFTEDKVVPTSWVERATADEVRLQAGVGNLDDLPEFEEIHYLPYDFDGYATGTTGTKGDGAAGYARPLYAYPPLGANWLGLRGAYGYPMRRYGAGAYSSQLQATEVERNIPEGTVALKQGTSVFDNTGDKVGSVVRVFTDGETQEATHLLISEGWLFKEKRLVPVDWIRDVSGADVSGDEAVHLKVSADFLQRVPEYREQEQGV